MFKRYCLNLLVVLFFLCKLGVGTGLKGAVPLDSWTFDKVSVNISSFFGLLMIKNKFHILLKVLPFQFGL